MQKTVKYKGSENQATAGFSPAIWADCPINEMQSDPGYGYFFMDDFLAHQTAVASTTYNNWYAFIEGDTTIKGTAAAGGAVALYGSTDNITAIMSYSGTILSAPFVIPAASSSGKKLWFECRIKRSVITDAKGGFFVGLADEAACADDFMDDDGIDFGDDDFIGFHGDETDDSLGSHVHAICSKTSGTLTTIVDTVGTFSAADTYMKLGFVYDPDAPTSKRIKFYVDNVLHATKVGETATDATVYITDTTNFPGGEELAPIIALKNAHADDFTVSVDWIACAQRR